MSITKIKTTSREEWLEERKKSLGGSDMGSVLGMNEYSSPYTIWAEKTGKLPPFEGNEWTRLGNDLEDYVAKRFTEKSGLKVAKDTATWRNSKYPHLHANIDRKIVRQRAGLECKVTSTFSVKSYRDGNFPDRFYAQCVEYLCVTELDRWYLAVLVYGKGIFIYQLTRIPDDTTPEWCESSVYVDDAEIKALAKAGNDFWVNHVETNIPPMADGSSSTTESIKTIFPVANGGSVNLFGYEQDIKAYMNFVSLIKDLEKQRDEVANRIKLFMGEAGKGETDGHRVSWSGYEKKTFDAKRYAADHPNLDLSKYYNNSFVRPFKITEK